MKKVVICTIMSLVLTNCQNIIEEPLSGIDSFSFFASTEDFSSKTKTHIDDNNNILWSPNDQLAIFQGSSLADKYQVTEETAGTMNGKFDIVKSGSEINDSFNSGTEVATNVAIYPFAESLILSAATSDREDTHLYNISGYTLPSEQEYARNSFAEQSFPMVAVTADLSDHNLKFKNVTGAIKLNIKGDIIVKSIKIKGNNGEKLSGPATIFVHSDNSAPTIKLGNDANNGITLICKKGVQLNNNETTAFIISTPPVTFTEGFNVTITDSDSKEYIISATSENHVLRSSILTMPEITIESSDNSTTPDNTEDYIDEYNINHGPGIEIKGVVWAPVNCGYHAVDFKWGKLYQWGRKYGQGYSGEIYDENGDITEDFSDTIIPSTEKGGVSIISGRSEDNSNVYFISEDDNDWIYPSDTGLWNDGTDNEPVKTINDPCPKGWRVPTYNEFNALCDSPYSFGKNDEGIMGCWFGETDSKIFLPAAGGNYRQYNSWDRGACGFYWSSNAFTEWDGGAWRYYDVANMLRFEIFNDDDPYICSNNRAVGYPVRCVKYSGDEDFNGTHTPSNKNIETYILDDTTHPYYIGGAIHNSNDNFVKKGIIVSIDKNSLFYDEYATLLPPYLEDHNDENRTDNLEYNLEYKIIDCTNIGEMQFNIPLTCVYGNTKYFARAFAINDNNETTYGNIVEFITANFNRENTSHDQANVWYTFASGYSLFDLATDETIDGATNGFYYSTHESPEYCGFSYADDLNVCFKFKSEWNYKLWYYNCHKKDEVAGSPIMKYIDGKLHIYKQEKDSDKNIEFYYTINTNGRHPETFTEKYVEPLDIKAGDIVYCYATTNEGYMSYTNLYKKL